MLNDLKSMYMYMKLVKEGNYLLYASYPQLTNAKDSHILSTKNNSVFALEVDI